MEKILSINIKDMVKSPYLYILVIVMLGLYTINNTLIASKNEEIQRALNELQKCNTELERRNKILEEIVFNQNISKNDK
jgi:hypothetical protein